MAIIMEPFGAKLDRADSSPEFKVGTVARLDDGGTAVYISASSAIAVNDAVGIDENFAGAPLTKAMADDGWNFGVAADVAIGSGSYGWARKQGSNFSVNVLASCGADVPLYTSATAGSLDDSSSSQTKIDGIVIVTADGGSGSAIECIATYPKSTTF
jgi:hypothetical protein